MSPNKKTKPKGVIVYLSRSTEKDIAYLKKSLSLLDVNFNDQFNYPVIIFHEDFGKNLIKEVSESTHSNINFVKIIFKIPSFLKKEEIPEFIYIRGNYKFPIGYRHMCRFFTAMVFNHTALKEYDWFWRFDTDSFLIDKLDYDVFDFMQKHNYNYGYIFKSYKTKYPEVIDGLWSTTKRYIEENNIKPTFLQKHMINGCWDTSSYFTCFEITKIDFWRSKEVMNYFNYIDKSGGIYKYRWGDAPLHFLMVSMFMPEKQVHKFTDIAYRHQEYVNAYSKNWIVHTKLKIMKYSLIGYNILKTSKVIRKVINLLKIKK